ncbi:MAG: ankyrin repeat domain-containing protein [Pseudomonadota bacterium]|uniref:ankyrin repeat domain-containing protein n=1 Tax=Sphingomonas sp. ERG5 TaxID=1381597 RepID=UPI00054C62F3|nr:ankyrin repeat domain-containing protein [Sphingomonas sp. ERG5]
MTVRLKQIALAAAASLMTIAVMATGTAHAQQQSESYKFLQAVRDSKGDDVLKMLNQPGSRIINTRDIGTREGALHIVVKRGDAVYLRFLLQQQADPNLRDGDGNTPLALAVNGGQPALVDILIAAKANVNLGNSRGETPLILAVQRRDVATARSLIAAGADPDQPDLLAGMSARDYAHDDKRSQIMAKLIDETPKKPRQAVSGPKL